MTDSNNKSGFYLLSDNTDAFVARFAMATIAEKTLDIQYYIMHNDASGQYLAYALLTAADRGVHVRILVDDINLSGRDSSLKMLGQHENIEIRIFNPLSNRDWFRNLELIINLNKAGRRMHNKTFVVDNYVAIIGGRNIGDEYFDDRHRLNFVDLDLLATGPIVNDITDSFNEYWHSQWATPIESLSKIKVVKKQLTRIRSKLRDKWRKAKNTEYFHSIQQADLTKKIISKQIPFIWARAALFYDRPEKINKSSEDNKIHFSPEIMPYLEQAKHELLIASPYFVPGLAGSHWFENRQQQGTQIKILTNSLAATDVIAVHAGYKKYRETMVKAGITLFELKPTAKYLHSRAKRLIEGFSSASLHAKYMVIDQRYVFIGSANIDPRSKDLNTEIGIMVDSHELARQTAGLFQSATAPKNCYRLLMDKRLTWITEEYKKTVRYMQEPNASLLRKFGVFMLSLLPFESLL
ncbi:MAG: phospholipase D family protein [Gammaproteobacteria bacterium]|nr:phospholipase D family protein [Gammaproteobacteria bacterium]